MPPLGVAVLVVVEVVSHKTKPNQQKEEAAALLATKNARLQIQKKKKAPKTK